MGKDYSFIVSWSDSNISTNDSLQEPNGEPSRLSETLGLSVSFPSEKIYYPLRPTAAYGEKAIWTTIYVLGYAQPELFAGIQNAEIDYYFQRELHAPAGLEDFFAGRTYEATKYRPFWRGNETEGLAVHDVAYTRIHMMPRSEDLTQDLWIRPVRPLVARLFEIPVPLFLLIVFLIPFLLSSCLASLLAGKIMFPDSPWQKRVRLGLWNLLSLLGVAVAVACWPSRRWRKFLFLVLFSVFFLCLTALFHCLTLLGAS